MTAPIITTPKPFLTRPELAVRWSCSLSTIKRREASGDLVPIRLGPRLVRYAMADIAAIENGSPIEQRLSGETPEIKAATAGQVPGTPVSGTTTTNQTHDATCAASRKNR